MNNEDRILDKLDELDSRLLDIDVTLARNTLSLELHERRTTLSEERLKLMENQVLFINALGRAGLFVVGLSGFLLTLLEIKKSLGG